MEDRYIRLGEERGIHKRYIPAHRKPWYSMEQREVAPIWGSVFGRGDLEFVFNAARVKSLTNFHCIYPYDASENNCRALTAVLNSSIVRARSKLHARGFGGGLAKFEPKDLLTIPVPDLRLVDDTLKNALSDHLEFHDSVVRRNKGMDEAQSELSVLIERAEKQAQKRRAAGDHLKMLIGHDALQFRQCRSP
jgi:adenine-specific DNA-methyltransferase